MLHLFGKPYVELDGRPLEGLPTSAYLLVALLTLKHGGAADRSELAAFVRENSDSKSASGYLRMQLLRIKRWSEANGASVFAIDGRMLARTPDYLRSDLDTFIGIESVSTARELEDLLSLYRGDFLAGVDAGGQELKEWIGFQQNRLRERFIRLATAGAVAVGGTLAERARQRIRDEGPLGDDTASTVRQRPAARASVNADRISPTPPQTPPVGVLPRVALLLPIPGGPYSFSIMQKLLASSIVEDVTLSLCRLRAVATIAPHTMRNLRRGDPIEKVSREAVDYVVESRLVPARNSEDDVVLTLSLSRTRTGEMVWATEAGLSRARGPNSHAELAAMLATTLVDAVAEAELRTSATTMSATAYHHYLLGRRYLRNLDRVNLRKAYSALKRAKSLATNFAPASSLLARTLSLEWVLLGRPDPARLVEAERLAKEAIEQDPFDASGYRELGRAALFLYGPEASLEHFYNAERYAPHHADILADSADTLVHNADIEPAHKRMDLALSLNPIPPDEYRWTAGAIRFFRGEYQEGLQMLRAMRQPEPASRLMAACAAMAGDKPASDRYREQALSLHPDFTIGEWMRVMPQRGREQSQKYVEALRLAGFK